MSNQKKEFEDIIIGLLQTMKAKPEDAITAIANVLMQLLHTTCEMDGWSKESVLRASDFLNRMSTNLLEAANKNNPATDEGEFLTIDELHQRVMEDADKTDREVDIQARANACKQIMETETIGFLLISYLKSGAVSFCTNLKDDNMRNEVLQLLKELLYNNDGDIRFQLK